MALTRFRNLDKIGVVTDVPFPDLPVNAWTDALNVRFDAGKISGIGGWDIIGTASCISDQTPLCIVKSPLSQGTYFYASDKFIYSVYPNISYNPADPTSKPDVRYNVTPHLTGTGSVAIPDYDVHTDLPITTTVMDYTITPRERWVDTMIANRVIFNSEGAEPISQNDTSVSLKDAFVPLKGWGIPKNASGDPNKGVKLTWRCSALHAFKDHLLALNMDEGSFAAPNATVNIPNRVRWSTYAFENQVPQNWFDDDEDNVEGDGGFVDLMDAGSAIIDGAVLRDYFMIYTSTETYLMRYVGGNDVFANERVFNDSGMLAKGCVAEYEGWHYVVTGDDFIRHDGSQKQSLIQGTIRDRLLSELSSVNTQAVRVFTNPIRREVWIAYPYSPQNAVDVTEYRCNRAAVFNTTSNTWTFTDLPDIYDVVVGEVISNVPESTWGTGAATNPTDIAWDTSVNPWTVQIVAMGNNRLFACSANHCLQVLDVGHSKWHPNFPDPTKPTDFTRTNNGFMYRFVERKSIDMDEVVEEIGRVKTWRRVYPQMIGNGSFTWKISGTKTLGGVPKTRPDSIFTIGNQYKIDLRFSERYINVRVETSADDEWNWTSYDVDYVVEGRR